MHKFAQAVSSNDYTRVRGAGRLITAMCLPQILPCLVKRAVVPAQCLLPGCTLIAKHRGGYCSAEHCRQHREANRGKT